MGGLGSIIGSGVLMFLAIPMLIYCFFGYKLQKLLITLSGIGTGAIVGALIGALSLEEAVIILSALILAILGGFIAYKLFRIGIFLQFWLLGTLVFAALFAVARLFELIPVSIILGLLIGILALVLHKGFVILTTAISGGMIAGACIGLSLGQPVLSIVIGILLAVLGAVVQFALEKKPAPKAQTSAPVVIQVPVAAPQATVQAAAVQTAATPQISASTTPEQPTYTELAQLIPKQYCPKSKVLLDLVTLSKDSSNNTYLQFILNNIGDSTLIAVYFNVKGYGVAGENLGNHEYNLIDLQIDAGDKYFSDRILLFNNSIRRVEIILTQIVKSNYDVVKFEESDTLTLPELTPIRESISGEIAELLALAPNETFFYKPLEEDLWVCTCGRIGYLKCSQCGRSAAQSLKNTDSDVLTRISDNVNRIASEGENCTTPRDLEQCKNKLEKIIELLTKCGLSEELTNRCNAVLADICTKQDILQSKKKQKRKKTTKVLTIMLSIVGAVLALGLLIFFITELPPSDKKVESDAETFLSDYFGDDYNMRDLEYKKVKDDNDYMIFCEAELKNPDNKDIIDVEFSLEYRNKIFRPSTMRSGRVQSQTVSLNHEISEKDNFTVLGITLYCLNDWFTVYPDNDYGDFKLTYDIHYSEITVTNNTAIVPISVRIDSLNTYTETLVYIPYKYIGNYCWEPTQFIELQAEPKNLLSDAASFEQILRSTTIEYPHAAIPEDMALSGQYLSVTSYDEPYYYYNYTAADLHAEVSWDNGMDKFTGSVSATMEYTEDGWQINEFQWHNITKPTRYAYMSDAELQSLIEPYIIRDSRKDITSITYLDAVATENSLRQYFSYTWEDDNFQYEFLAFADLQSSLTQGYIYKEMLIDNTNLTGLKEEIHETAQVNYSLSCSNATPTGVPLSGTTDLTIDIDSNANVCITGSIGHIGINLNGYLVYPNNISIAQFHQDVYVTYSIFFTTSADLAFRVTPSLTYRDSKLTGTLSFDSVGIGAGDFVVILE